jgi:hypothetical protein
LLAGRAFRLGILARSRIVDELGAIAFSDLGDFVDWDNETQHVAADIKDRIDADVETGDRPAAEVVTITNRVTLKPSHKLTPALRRAVAKVSQDRYGNVSRCMTSSRRWTSSRAPLVCTRNRCMWKTTARRTSERPSFTKVEQIGHRDVLLHPNQWVALETPATEVLYGGAGGGKSFLMREAAISWCPSPSPAVPPSSTRIGHHAANAGSGCTQGRG